ncbi:MAG: 5-(carboxyamino)imidazole ribonucleotide mutase [Desulfomonile sp.]|nr:5-(carboxyamino)imidazole ribonucleotide mutase [Desulfomonile sp.]
MTGIQIGIVMGSDSDVGVMKKAADILERFEIPYYMTVASAHRTPDRVAAIAERAEREGWKLLIAGAGMAAHLAGFLAAHTVVPVVGVPIDSSSLNGLDALLATVQMPGGVPVATMGIGAAGAKNAGILAVEVLAAFDPTLREKLRRFREEQKAEVEKKAAQMETSSL